MGADTRWVQPGERGVDFSYTKPPPQRLVELGYTFVVGYYTTPPSNPKKILTDPQPYIDVGLVVIYVFEKTATRATEGATAGLEDGLAFAKFLDTIGCPWMEAPQIAADDTGTSATNIWAKQAYMDAFRSVMSTQGAYTGSKLGRTIDWELGWLPNAWSWSVGVNTSTAISRADARQAAINLGYHVIQSTGFYIDNLYPVDPNEVVKPFLGWCKAPPVSQEADMSQLLTNSQSGKYSSVVYPTGGYAVFVLNDDGTKRAISFPEFKARGWPEKLAGLDGQGRPFLWPTSDADLDALPNYVPPVTTIPPVVIPPITIPTPTISGAKINGDLNAGGKINLVVV